MTITTLQAAAQEDPRLRELDIGHASPPGVACGVRVGLGWLIDHPNEKPCPGCGTEWPDPRTILVTDDPGEVASMCKRDYACGECGPLKSDREVHEHRCEGFGNSLPVTGRIFLWDGSPVEWEAVLPEPARYEAEQRGSELHNPRLVNPLTAVVLVGEPDVVYKSPPGSDRATSSEPATVAAREACAQDGVGFHVLGDGTAVAL